MEVDLTWLGPYVFVPQEGFDCVFDVDQADGPGLYLWTVAIDDGYLINYVGETGREIWQRLIQNVAHSFGGRDGSVSDPVLFRQGMVVTLAKFDGYSEFMADYARLSSAIFELYRCYRIFIAPTSLSRSDRKFVEAGIIRTLRVAGGRAEAFLQNDHLIGPSPEPLTARILGDQQFHGLGRIVRC